jgi:hypothetical protein
MDNSPRSFAQQATFEDHNTSKYDDCVHCRRLTLSSRSNVATKRSLSRDWNVSRYSESAIVDGRSDSGYSSYTASTPSCADSASALLSGDKEGRPRNGGTKTWKVDNDQDYRTQQYRLLPIRTRYTSPYSGPIIWPSPAVLTPNSSPEPQLHLDSRSPERYQQCSRTVSVHQRQRQEIAEWSGTAMQRTSHVYCVSCSDSSCTESDGEEAHVGCGKRDDTSIIPLSTPTIRQRYLVDGTKSGEMPTDESDLLTKDNKRDAKGYGLSRTEKISNMRIAMIDYGNEVRAHQVSANQHRLLRKREARISKDVISEHESEARIGDLLQGPRQEKTNATAKEKYQLGPKGDDNAPPTPSRDKTIDDHQSSQTECQQPCIATPLRITEADTYSISELGPITQPQIPRTALVMLPNIRPNDMRQDSHNISPRRFNSLGSLGESASSTTGEGKDLVSMEGTNESDEASEECEVHVESALSSAMNVVKNLILRELLDNTLPDAKDAVHGSSASTSGTTGSSASLSLASSSSVNSQAPQRSKRPRGNERSSNNGNGNDSDDEDRPKKKGDRGLADRLPRRRLKCPFYQREPERYTKAACRGTGFADMAKLKDHIKRVHTQKLRCPRCWLDMDSEEACDEHLRQKFICQRGLEPQEDGIRPQLLRRLDFKKAPYSNARNVEEKWKMLFSVLFPTDRTIPSPCKSNLSTLVSFKILTRVDEQQGMSPRLEHALCEALEEELTRELAHVVEPIMKRIKGCIPAIIENCRQKLNNTASSSEDEAVFTPSVASSRTGSSKSGRGSSTKAARHWVNSTTFRCELPSVSESLPNELQDEILQSSIPCAEFVDTLNPQHSFTMEHGADHDLFISDAHNPCAGSRDTSIETSSDLTFDLENISGLHTYSATLAGSSDSTAGSKLAAVQDAHEPILEPYGLGGCSPPQDHVCLSDLSDLAASIAGDRWDQMNTRQGDVGAKWQDSDLFPHLFAPGDWDYLTRDLDI